MTEESRIQELTEHLQAVAKRAETGEFTALALEMQQLMLIHLSACPVGGLKSVEFVEWVRNLSAISFIVGHAYGEEAALFRPFQELLNEE